MRRYLLLLAPLLLSFLMACDPGVKPGPRIDFVGSSRFTSSDRIVTTPGDTVSSLLYADVRDMNDYVPLRRLEIIVRYEPNLTPSRYLAGTQPATDSTEYVYLDSTLAPNTKSLVFRHDFTARTTPGRETWRFIMTDEEGKKASRQYRLTVRRSDSAAVLHSYNTLLQAPRRLTRARRSFLDADEGLALTGYAAQSSAVQQSIDLAYVLGANNAFGLAAPASGSIEKEAATSLWAIKNATQLRTTTLKVRDFEGVDIESEVVNAFNEGTPSGSYIPAIAEGSVIAFRTSGSDDRTGLIYVQDILPTAIPTVLIQVRVSKQRVR